MPRNQYNHHSGTSNLPSDHLEDSRKSKNYFLPLGRHCQPLSSLLPVYCLSNSCNCSLNMDWQLDLLFDLFIIEVYLFVG